MLKFSKLTMSAFRSVMVLSLFAIQSSAHAQVALADKRLAEQIKRNASNDVIHTLPKFARSKIKFESLTKFSNGEISEVFIQYALPTTPKQLSLESPEAYQRDVQAQVAQMQALKKPVYGDFKEDQVVVIREYQALPLSYVKVKDASTLASLLKHPGVAAINEPAIYTTSLTKSLPLIKQPEAIAYRSAPPNQASTEPRYDGSGSVVVVADSGIAENPAFGDCTHAHLVRSPGCRVLAWLNLTGPHTIFDPTLTRVVNGNHGTAVAGVVAAVAPGAKLISMNVSKEASESIVSEPAVIAAVDIAIRFKYLHLGNIVAMNMSFGVVGPSLFTRYPDGSCDPGQLSLPIGFARNAGILPVAAAGNEGFNGLLTSPACDPRTVSVGAVHDAYIGSVQYTNIYGRPCTDHSAPDLVSCMSNSSQRLTLLAPGIKINAAGAISTGTSFSAPHVAGAVAILRAPGIVGGDSLDDTVQRMTSTGQPVYDAFRQVTTPRLDLFKAVRSTRELVR